MHGAGKRPRCTVACAPNRKRSAGPSARLTCRSPPTPSRWERCSSPATKPFIKFPTFPASRTGHRPLRSCREPSPGSTGSTSSPVRSRTRPAHTTIAAISSDCSRFELQPRSAQQLMAAPPSSSVGQARLVERKALDLHRAAAFAHHPRHRPGSGAAKCDRTADHQGRDH